MSNEKEVSLPEAIAIQLVEGFAASYGLDDEDYVPAVKAVADALREAPESVKALVGTNIMPHNLIESWEEEEEDE